MRKAIVSWSSGKDSAMALYRVLIEHGFEIAGLITTVTEKFQRVSMHGVREELLDAQAASLGYFVDKVFIPYPCPNSVYEEKMANVLSTWKSKGVRHVIFGDLFLEDIRKYRENRLSQIEMTPAFPLWGEDTTTLAKQMLLLGFRALVTCVDPKKLDPTFAGRPFDQAFLNDLPSNVDPCGENGEFHTFVYDGPVFTQPIPVETGDRVMRDGFQFVDIKLRKSNQV